MSVSKRTLRRRIKDLGYKSCRSAKKPLISEKNRKKRLEFYKAHKNFSVQDWGRIIWTDESRFKLFNPDGKLRVWRESNQRLNPDCIVKTVQGCGGSVLIWGCFYGDKLGPLIFLEKPVNSDIYINQILKPFYNSFYLPSIENGQSLTLQQDNAPAHKSERTRRWLIGKKITMLTWPAQSPDLNLIESLWNLLKRKINTRDVLPLSLGELRNIIREEWEKITQSE